MKITIIGCGGMGKEIKSVAEERGHKIISICDPISPEATHKNVSTDALKDADIAIDFSIPDVVLENTAMAAEAGVSLIVGTTGWYEKMDEIKKIIGSSDIGFLWSANFSIGVNLYLKIVEYATKLFNEYEEYDVWGHEIHHKNKADSPSGTAKTLEKIIIKNIDRKTKVVEETLQRKITPEELHFTSTRAGDVNFAHTISFDSAADAIKLKHDARDRGGYALGAVKAAEWLNNKKGFYEIKDFLGNQ